MTQSNEFVESIYGEELLRANGGEYAPEEIALAYLRGRTSKAGDKVRYQKSLPLPDCDDRDWRTKALCIKVDPELFFPVGNRNSDRATAFCRQCPVKDECLDFALKNKELNGIWGGITQGQREVMRRSSELYPTLVISKD